MVYATPNATDYVGILSYANYTTDGIFWALIVITIFILTFLALKNWATRQAAAAAGFNMFISALPLWLLGLVSNWIFALAVVIMLGTAALLFMQPEVR